MRYLFEMLLGWLIAKRNGGEYFFMEDECPTKLTWEEANPSDYRYDNTAHGQLKERSIKDEFRVLWEFIRVYNLSDEYYNWKYIYSKQG